MSRFTRVACVVVSLCARVQSFVPPSFVLRTAEAPSSFMVGTTATTRAMSPGSTTVQAGSLLSVRTRSQSASRRCSPVAMMAASGDEATDKKSIANAGALAFAAGSSVVASGVAEISPHAAAFVQLVCLSIWLGMSVYTTFVWPIITGINMRDSSEFASLLGKLGPSYLQVSAAMIMSLATSSVAIGHANEVQLVILGIALSITLYNVIVLEPSAVVALEKEMAVEKRMRGGNKKLAEGEDLPKMQANLANFLGAEVLLDFLCILCALCYAWDLASSITIA